MAKMCMLSQATGETGDHIVLYEEKVKPQLDNAESRGGELTGILSGYFSLIRLASDCLLSVTHDTNR